MRPAEIAGYEDVRPRATQHVLPASDGLYVKRIHAPSMSAEMVSFSPCRERPDHLLIENSMN